MVFYNFKEIPVLKMKRKHSCIGNSELASVGDLAFPRVNAAADYDKTWSEKMTDRDLISATAT